MSFLQCFNTSKHPYSSLPAEAFPCRNKKGEDGRTLPLATDFFKTALRVVRFDTGMKGAVTSRHQDFHLSILVFVYTFCFKILIPSST